MHSRRLTAILLIGDTLVLLAFILLGRLSHNMSAESLNSGMITTVSLLVPWLITVFAVRATPLPDMRTFLQRSVAAWLIAVPLGLMLRAFLLGSNAISLPFMTTTLLLGGAFVLGWRLVFALIWLRSKR